MWSERRRRLVRHLLAATADLAEPLWRVGFWLAGSFSDGKTHPWQSGGGRQVLVLAPHPDDEAAGCAGVIGLHKRAGDRVCLGLVTDGRMAASTLTPEQLAVKRMQEARCAAEILQIDRLVWMGFEEGSSWVVPYIGMLTALLDELQPDVIYTTSRLDIHPDHHRTAYGLAQALEGCDLAPVVRSYQVHTPLTAVLTNLVADVTAQEGVMRAALACYESQWWHLGRTLRTRRYAARYYRRGACCEPFREMTVEAFCRVHGQTPDFDRNGKHWPLSPSGGVRFFSWRDPLPYLKGRSWRRMQILSDR